MTYPRWIWADPNGLRVEVEYDAFIDYVRFAGVWRQKTHPMTDKESVTPAAHLIGDWRERPACWPVVDGDMAAWLDKTLAEVAR